MFNLKPLDPNAVPSALEKAKHYRMLNNPRNAESICRDILVVDERHQEALVTLVLSLTDQFPRGLASRIGESWEFVERLTSEYERCYYSGIICERRAKAHAGQRTPGCGHLAYDWLRQAMDWYEKAESVRPDGNDDTLLRWNSCARHIDAHSEICQEPVREEPPALLE